MYLVGYVRITHQESIMEYLVVMVVLGFSRFSNFFAYFVYSFIDVFEFLDTLSINSMPI